MTEPGDEPPPGRVRDELRDEARAAGRAVVGAGLAAATTALIAWIRTRPMQRWVQARRARRSRKG